MNRRMQAQQGHLQPTACSQRKEPEGQRPDSLPRAWGPQRRPEGLGYWGGAVRPCVSVTGGTAGYTGGV